MPVKDFILAIAVNSSVLSEDVSTTVLSAVPFDHVKPSTETIVVDPFLRARVYA